MELSENLTRKSRKNLTSRSVDAALQPFVNFHDEVKLEFNAWTFKNTGSIDNRNKLLNGGANVAAFSLIDQKTRKDFGIFFSGHELADLVASKVAKHIRSGASVIDPTCGAGDLLIACARHYKKQADFESTIALWSSKLAGIDLHKTFIDTAKSRLKLLATESFLPSTNPSGSQATEFEKLIIDNALTCLDLISGYDLVVTNPPYGTINAPTDILWAKGNIQTAGLFLDRILRSSKRGQEIVAVLPDVLRSGTRYSKWREWITQNAKVLSINVVGKFDKTTDVDVFVLHLRAEQSHKNKWPQTYSLKKNDQRVAIGSLFNVRIGPVVPHRDLETGPVRKYIDCSQTKDMSDLHPAQNRAFNSTPYRGPFIVIRRTSSPNDSNRLVASIVITKNLVMVENHLIIVQPIDGKLSTCRKLLIRLKDKSATDWINQRIRCRHLTVSSIRELPINW
ncbi:MAG: N-6 DNA methylase [Legionella sp.]|nr:hypothetical protein [Chlorobiaceae bacterium]MDP3268980.1 N-6 DNA methylase [Legionella sp.]